MNLQALLKTIDTLEVHGETRVPVTGVAFDSRQAARGNVFVCLEGLQVDGHEFGATVAKAGVSALVVRHWLSPDVPQVKVRDTRVALAQLAAAFFNHPSLDLTLIGTTGTNGKTTVAQFLKNIGSAAGFLTEISGTFGVSRGRAFQSTGLTTPEAPRLQQFLRQAVSNGVDWIAMECSSHALAQKRTLGSRFDCVVFTNLSRDHLDFHSSMERYFQAKSLLFEVSYRKEDGIAVINLDDPYGKQLFEKVAGRKISYGFSQDARVWAQDVVLGPDHSSYTLVTPDGRIPVRLGLPGRYNIQNALAAQCAALQLGVALDDVVAGVEQTVSVPGRMERIPGRQPFNVYVDYAHTPDGLRFALGALRELTHESLWVVFGCGGDRDRGKRPLMGSTAESLADRVVITSDNPRSEKPEAILQEVADGLTHRDGAYLQVDREAAIRWVFRRAKPGDTVLIAGKGHEATQSIKDRVINFDDRQVARRLLKEMYENRN